MNIQDSQFKELLSRYKKFSVYGLGPLAEKPSFYVPEYMRANGWDIVGTYPKIHSAGGFKIFKGLSEVPLEYRKFVNVFRRSDAIGEVVDEVLAAKGVEVLWLQLGISNPEHELRAEKAGLQVVSNRCLIIEHKKWF